MTVMLLLAIGSDGYFYSFKVSRLFFFLSQILVDDQVL
jgi:hypothetical protein